MPSVAVSEPVTPGLHRCVKSRVQNTNSLRSDRCILNSNTNLCEPRVTKTPANATEGIWLLALFKVTEGLGLGMGGMNGTCGAISAAAVLAGLKDSTGDLELANSKAVSYKDARECIARFLEKNQSVVCRDLKGVETGNVLRACPDCISDAVEIIGEVLF